MSLKTSGDLYTLDTVFQGGPYVVGFAKTFTDNLDYVYQGGPYTEFQPFGAATSNVTNVVYIKTGASTWSTGTVYIKSGASTWSEADDVYFHDGVDWNS